MAAKGASLQNYNNELTRCIEDLREKREEVNRSILRNEEEKVMFVAVCACECTRRHQRVAADHSILIFRLVGS